MQVEVKVTTVISVENVELGVADREQVVAAKVIKYVTLRVDLCLCNNIRHYCLFCLRYIRMYIVINMSDCVCNVRLQHPAKATNEIEVDNHQRLTLKFQLRDKTSGSLIAAHQTFVRMVQHKSQQEVIFVAEPDSANTYKLDLVSIVCAVH